MSSRERSSSALSIQIIVPTRNGGPLWREAATAIARACDRSQHCMRVCVVDTVSSDGTEQIAREFGFEIKRIGIDDFDHGGTRNQAVDQNADVAIFLTQDAVLDSDDALDILITAFEDSKVAVAYGRQLPHINANPIAKHARLFNYPPEGRSYGRDSAKRYGIKSVFASNAFSAYRVSAFRELGGFPPQLILSEDMYFAAKASIAGYYVAYVGAAHVRHSHNYSPIEEFRRYFDIGVFQSEQAWIGQEFGGPGGEGKRFLMSELRYLGNNAPLWLPRAAINNLAKAVGYQLGKAYRLLPHNLCKRLSMHPRYWKRR